MKKSSKDFPFTQESTSAYEASSGLQDWQQLAGC